MKNFLAIMLLLIPINTYAEVDGNELYSLLTSDQTSENFKGLMFINGLIQMEDYHKFLEHTLAKEKNRAPDKSRFPCFPANATAGQAVDLVRNYLRNHPEDRHYNAAQLGHFAMIQAWPCSK
jgi:hypothetical protein